MSEPEMDVASLTEGAQYVGQQVQIGGGFGGMKPLAQSGLIVIKDGILTLLGTEGQLIARAPLEDCELKTGLVRIITQGQGVFLVIAGTRYSVSVGHSNVNPIFNVIGASRKTSGFIRAFNERKGTL